MLLLSVMLSLALPSAQAAIYSTVDASGQRVFTDQPLHHTAKPVTLNTTNQIAGDPQTLPLKVLRPPAQIQTPTHYQISILNPIDGQTVQDGSGTLVLELTSSPELNDGHRYQALINHQPWGEPGQSPSIILAHLDRGTHTLAVQIINQQGQPQAISPSQTVHIRRVSLSDRKRLNPCRMDDYGRRLECPLKDKPKPKSDVPFVPFI